MNIDSKIQFLKKIGCDEVGHRNQTLLDHLIGVYNLLKSWDAPEYVQDAGLFHSVYGTTYFKPQIKCRVYIIYFKQISPLHTRTVLKSIFDTITQNAGKQITQIESVCLFI